MLMTVSAARRTLHRGPLVFGDERQLRMLKLDIAASRLERERPPNTRCPGCDGGGTVGRGFKMICELCEGFGTLDLTADAIARMTPELVGEVLKAVEGARPR